MNQLRQLPLEDRHTKLGARFGEFAGWRMPLWYSGALEEHLAVRERAGVFDISHMGRFFIEGPDAASLIASVTTRDPARLSTGGSAYGFACNDAGGIIDDLIVYRLGDERFSLICNAANAGKIAVLLNEASSGRTATIEDVQARTTLLAVQGPRAVDLVSRALSPAVDAIARRTSAEVVTGGETCFVARTGYTGEDGFEVLASPEANGRLFDALVASVDCVPCGLAARDSLRLEAALALHGLDIDETRTPWEAGLSWAVELDHEFLGRDALVELKDKTETRLACILSDGAGVFRHGYGVFDGDAQVATACSGGYSPMLERSIAMAFLPRRLAREGTQLSIDIRGKRVGCHTVKRPFYTPPTAG